MRVRYWLLGLFSCLAGAGHASPLISWFDFETRTGFQNWACASAGSCGLLGTGAISGFGGATLQQHLSWGTGSTLNPFVMGGGNPQNPAFAQSQLHITNYIGPGHTIVTDGGWTNINQFTHVNHIITIAGGALGAVNVNGWFQLLSPVALDIAQINPVTFLETVNVGAKNCPGPNPWGTACDDVFTITPLAEQMQFYYDGTYRYFLAFRFFADPSVNAVIVNPDGTVSLYTREACSAGGAAGACVGGYQPGVTTVYTQARIWTVLPLSNPLLFMMLGGFLLAAFARRRN